LIFLNKKANLNIEDAAPTGGRDKNVSFILRPVMAALYISASWFYYLRVLGTYSSSFLASDP
jgi:hypothetical protein